MTPKRLKELQKETEFSEDLLDFKKPNRWLHDVYQSKRKYHPCVDIVAGFLIFIIFVAFVFFVLYINSL